MKEKYLSDSKFGRISSPAITAAAILLTVVIFLAFYQNLNIFAGLGILPITGFVVFAKSGICISADKKNYKSYISFLGIKFGKWQQLSGYTDIAILKKTVSNRAYSRANVSAEVSREKFYDICLLSTNHRRKLVIARFVDKDIAFSNLHQLADKLEFNCSEYNPVISEATKARR